jgi:hypothetical protein
LNDYSVDRKAGISEPLPSYHTRRPEPGYLNPEARCLQPVTSGLQPHWPLVTRHCREAADGHDSPNGQLLFLSFSSFYFSLTEETFFLDAIDLLPSSQLLIYQLSSYCCVAAAKRSLRGLSLRAADPDFVRGYRWKKQPYSRRARSPIGLVGPFGERPLHLWTTGSAVS